MSYQAHHDTVFSTNTYVWSNRDRLGYGATGAVFVGYHKVVGLSCVFAADPTLTPPRPTVDILE